MKRTSFLFLIALAIATNGLAQTRHKQLEVTRAEPKSAHCTEIPSSFSHQTVSESKALKAIQSQKINRVELLYTRYKEHEDFDQNQLNEDRMYRLKELLPRLKTDNPEIVWIEQTGAKTREEAANYFHGFRIYTQNEEQQTAFKRIDRKDAGNPASVFTVDNTKGGTFSHPSGTKVHIPANAVVYADGKRVIGNYTITYREYRDAAEIAFSGIPMTYKDKKGEYQFNSAGMYEIRGTKDGKELALQNDITVDFNCTKKEAGINFYAMDDLSGEWKILKNDLFGYTVNNITTFKSIEVLPAGIVHASTDQRLREGKAPAMYRNAITAEDSSLIEENIKGHQYPNLVAGIKASNFGVYNCDQVYRVANKIVVSPKYLDISDNKQIKKTDMVCLIDKAVNGSFSFGPRHITCNALGDNVFLLFTEDGKIYALKSEKDKRVNLIQKEPEFHMENITDKVKTSDDLKKYLSI